MSVSADQFKRWAADPAAFRADLRIEYDGQLARFGDVLEPWQDTAFRQTDAGWRWCMGHHVAGHCRSRSWGERPRGHSKTTDTAIQLAYALTFPRQQINGVASAADRDQAALIRAALQRLLSWNPWLAEILRVTNWTVTNEAKFNHPGKGSSLQIIASDVGSSYGILADFIVCDELCHWSNSGEQMWHSLLSSAAKRPHCFVQVLTNAGIRGSWQYAIREHARAESMKPAGGWCFDSLSGPQASWITTATLDEQRLLLPTRAYNRLWLNHWQDEGGDVLERADLEACITLADRPGPDDDCDYVGALDLSVRRDHSAFVALGVSRKNQHIHLAECHSWKPPRDGEIDLNAVQETVRRAQQRFKFVAVVYDEHQAAMMAQTLSRAGVPMERASLGAKHQMVMASAILEAFRSRRISLYRDADLIRDLLRLQITSTSYGYRLSAARTVDGHCDRASALAMALPRASELAASGGGVDLDAWLAYLGGDTGATQQRRDWFRPVTSDTPWSCFDE